MAKLLPTRTAQYPLYADFNFNFNDYVTDVATGSKVTMGSTVVVADPNGSVVGLTGAAANTITIDAIPMPPGAVITGGEVIVETAVAGSTAYTVSLGYAGSLVSLANAVSALAVGRTPLTLATPLTSNAGQNLRLTAAYTVANATAGRVRVRVQYSVDARTSEIVIV